MDQILDNNLEEKPEHTYFKKKEYPGIGQAFGLIGVLLLISLIIAFPLDFLKNAVGENYKSVINGIAYVFSMTVLLAFALKMRKSSKFQWKMVSLQILLLSIPLVVSLGILLEPIINAIPMPDMIKDVINKAITNDVYSFLTIAIAAPLLEEIIFRGIILQGFLKRYSPTKAIIWSAVMFGIFHMNPWQFLSAFSVGMVIGWLYYKTDSLIPGIFIHFINNALAFLMLMTTGDNFKTTQQLMGGGKSYYIFYSMCIPILIGSLFLIHQRLKMKEV